MQNQHQENFDLVVIGGGSAGLSVASGGAQLGLNVALVEAGAMGGDCLNAGCVPSKALLAVAKAKHQVDVDARNLGIRIQGEVTVEYADAMAHVRKSIAAIAPHDSQERFEGLGVTVIRARGKITGPHSVEAGARSLNATIIVVATGARPFVPPIPGIDQLEYDTNETLFHRTQKPSKLVIVGGGPIGCEMAQAHARLGCEVALVEMASLMPNDDPEAVDVVRQSLIADGVAIYEQHRLEQLVKTDQGFEAHCVPPNGEAIHVLGTDLLVAVGRHANVQGLGLEEAGVKFDAKGIQVDRRMRTNVRSIYALGDVAGGAQFTHMAGAHASAFVRGALFRSAVDVPALKVPWVTYCDPELAQFGMTEAKAKQAGTLAQVRRVELEALDRQVTEGDKVGFAKIMLDSKKNVLGVTIVGKGAGDLLTPWLVADAGKVKLRDVAMIIAPYPTRGEVTKRLAGLAFVDRLFADSTKRLVRFLFRLPRF